MSNIFDAVTDPPEEEKKNGKHNSKGKNKTGNNRGTKKNSSTGISKETKEKVKRVVKKEITVYDSEVMDNEEEDNDLLNDFNSDDYGKDGLLKDLSKLTTRSQEALLMKPILENKEKHFKIEQQKILLLKKAGDLAEVEFMKFVYLGYMEKISIDLLRMTKKLETRLKSFVEEGDYKGLVKLIDKEHSLILATVKKNQKEDLKKWEKENKRGRK